jgi:NAD(P)H-dependent flavin oxidoreductase YrpB (nitropropane dioxygenase family)
MEINVMNELVIGNVTAKVPIVQGGMGVGVSLHRLAGAVAKEGGIGVISAAQPGFRSQDFTGSHIMPENIKALAEEIRLAKEISGGGVIGVNIMVALKGYEEYVRCCIDAGADIIISGAGLPMDLPKYAKGSDIKLAPIVSSAKAAKVILSRWAKQEDVTADMVVIEGPKAGGHLGFKADEVLSYTDEMMDAEIKKILEVVAEYEARYNKKIPVIFGGGVYTRADIDHYLELGLSGVQMATRFVATEECDADINFKMAYVNAKKEDIVIVKSPVGMPGRAIENSFIRHTRENKVNIDKCYNCLAKCDPKTIPYCISQALFNAAEGDVDNALLFCGENAYRVDKITTVKAIFDELTKE